HLLGVRPSRQRAQLRPLHLGSSHELHSTRNLRRALNRPYASFDLAKRAAGHALRSYSAIFCVHLCLLWTNQYGTDSLNLAMAAFSFSSVSGSIVFFSSMSFKIAGWLDSM